VASEPAGANVFVDGQFQGTTPVEVARLAPGDHRVRLVKNGYLENSRGKKQATSPAQTVTVKSLTGTWAGNLAGYTGTFFTWTFTQSGTNISGTPSGADGLSFRVHRPSRDALWAWLLRRWSGWKDSPILVKPDTVIARHRRSFHGGPCPGLC
jgi:hypothetical protein